MTEHDLSELSADLASAEFARFVDDVATGTVPEVVRAASDIDLTDYTRNLMLLSFWRDHNVNAIISLLQAASMLQVGAEMLSADELDEFVRATTDLELDLVQSFRQGY